MTAALTPPSLYEDDRAFADALRRSDTPAPNPVDPSRVTVDVKALVSLLQSCGDVWEELDRRIADLRIGAAHTVEPSGNIEHDRPAHIAIESDLHGDFVSFLDVLIRTHNPNIDDGIGQIKRSHREHGSLAPLAFRIEGKTIRIGFDMPGYFLPLPIVPISKQSAERSVMRLTRAVERLQGKRP